MIHIKGPKHCPVNPRSLRSVATLGCFSLQGSFAQNIANGRIGTSLKKNLHDPAMAIGGCEGDRGGAGLNFEVGIGSHFKELNDSLFLAGSTRAYEFLTKGMTSATCLEEQAHTYARKDNRGKEHPRSAAILTLSLYPGVETRHIRILLVTA